VVYRLSPENVRPPRGGPSGALAILVVVGVVVGIWLLVGGDPGSSTGGGPAEDATSYAPPSAAPTVDPASGLPYVSPAQLPEAALDVFVAATGSTAPRAPAYDDAVGLLPAQEEGYYTAHRVPGSADGLLVVGAGDEAYWSTDGGTSFARVGP
jgi:hypothetical protein